MTVGVFSFRSFTERKMYELSWCKRYEIKERKLQRLNLKFSNKFLQVTFIPRGV
jgi:hypothetical protein